MTEKEIKNLLDKFLQGKATSAERNLLREYEAFSISKSKNQIFRSDLEKSKTKHELYSEIKKNIRPGRKKWLGIAASIVLFIGVGSTIWLSYLQSPYTMIVSNSEEPFKKIILNDGSTVILK